jgi:nicotinamidase-related amidase
MDPRALLEQSQPFLDYLVGWRAGLPTLDLAAELKEPQRAAVVIVDLTRGFCTDGPLSSPRVQAVVAPIVQLVERAHALGVPHLVLPQDTHEPDAVEFGSFAPHCVRDTPESVTVPELTALPFASHFTVITKNSINSTLAPGWQAWRAQHADVRTFIIAGDCTDFCVYQLAMALRVSANSNQERDLRVIVPADCVDTYDLPVDAAQSLGSLPHPGDLLHLVFLYHMALNGVEIVATAI